MTDEPRSHWGWGHASGFGTPDTRKALGTMVGTMLGLQTTEPREPTPPNEIDLDQGGVALPSELTELLSDDRELRLRRTFGRSFPDLYRGFHGHFPHPPDLVARPTEPAHLEELYRWAASERLALIPFGGGTSVVQGVTPGDLPDYQGLVTVDLQGLSYVEDLDEVDRVARIGAGTTGPDLEAALSPRGLTLRHYPQSFQFSTLGGWLATRAGGHFATNYTRIDDLTTTVTMVTPAGTLSTPQLPSTGAGIDPRSLILGSEGALGCITEAVMRLRPRHTFRSSVTVHFPDLPTATEACRHIAQAHLFPSNCRLLDAREALFNGVVSSPAHVLLLGFEGTTPVTEPLLEAALKIAIDAGGTPASDPAHRHRDAQGDSDRPEEAGRWRQAFFEAPYLQGRLLSVGILADTFETALPWSRFPRFHKDLKGRLLALMKARCGGGHLTLRFTHVYPDGPAPYYTFICAPPPEQTLEVWRAIKEESMATIADHGATVTHHHAVGRRHRPGLARERSSTFFSALKALKAELDPHHILNPGVLLP